MHNIELIIGLPSVDAGRSGYEKRKQGTEISTISRSLKAVAKELNVPIIALSQLSRMVERKEAPDSVE